VAHHRLHHKFAEIRGLDPHSPRDGRFWSHIGWLLYEADFADRRNSWRLYAPDLIKDKYHLWLQRLHFLPLVLLGTILALTIGWPAALWVTCLQVILGWHSTALVNSVGHMWGSRRFATNDDSRNNWYLATVTLGEGWHNNHHADPSAAQHGLFWYEIDVNWYLIRLLRSLYLVWDVRQNRGLQRGKLP